MEAAGRKRFCINHSVNGVETMHFEKGFTLIELLIVIGIILVLGMLGLTSYGVYRSDAAYAVAERTLRDGRTAIEAGLNTIDQETAPANHYAQAHPGPIADAAAAALLPSMMIPRNIKFQVSHDPNCNHAGCQAEFLQVNHCVGRKYISWVRFGDGLEFLQENVEGVGCS